MSKDWKNYVEEGWIESYITGDISAENRKLIENLRLQYPEAHNYITELETGMERYLQQYSMIPSPELKSQILNRIQLYSTPPLSNKPELQHASKNWFHWTHGLSIAAALTGLFFGIIQHQNNQKVQSEAQMLQAKLQVQNNISIGTEEKVQELQKKNQALLSDLEHINRRTTHLVALVSEDLQKSVKVYWCEKSKIAMVKVVDLPQLSDQEDYQLWRLVDGQPVNMGVIPEPQLKSGEMMIHEAVSEVDAFAITREEKGGKPNPTMEQLELFASL